MKVLHLLNSSSYSGAENVAITIINNIKKIETDIEFIYCSPFGKIEEVCQLNNIKFVGVNKLDYKNLSKVLKKYSPDIIHAHDFTALFNASLFKNQYCVIGHLHNNPMWLRGTNIKSLTFLFSIIRVKKLLFVSDSIINEFKYRKYIKKYLVVGNPLDYDKVYQHFTDNKENDIVFIGRLTEQKNPIRFLEIINELEKKGQCVTAIMIGEGELKDKCNNYIKENNLINITLTGFLPNPYELMSKSKITLMTSKWEGYGLVAVESLTLGTPVIATNVGGISSYLNNDIGLLYNDNIEAINEIIKLLTDKRYYESKRKKGICFSKQKFKSLSYFQKIIEIYENEEKNNFIKRSYNDD